MSEEEILDKTEQFIDDYRQYDTRTGETIIPYKYGEGQRYVYKETYYAIQGLLDLYNKEKEKNKNLNKYITDKLKTGKKIQTFINKGYVEQEYISKDKIREIANKRAETDGNYREAYYEILELLEERN